jgi:hypothetical protein
MNIDTFHNPLRTISDEGAGCFVCFQVFELINLAPFMELPKKVSIGTVKSLLCGNCKDHTALVRFVTPLSSGDDKQDTELQLCRPVDAASGVYLMIARTPEHSEVVEHLHLLRRADLPSHIGRSLSLNPNWIDIEPMRKWIRTCITQHGDKCEYPYKVFRIPRILPLWLIDTLRLCLVPGTLAHSYVTLSYVWGTSNPFTTTKSKLEQLKQPGALKHGCFGKYIPKTITDSVGLVPLLGERYIWVDALCIVQDDKNVKSEELKRMAAIYASSVFTIIAGDGADFHGGLRGIRGVSGHRHIEQRIERFGKQDYLVAAIFSRAQEVLSSSPYRDRAWTYQESVCTKRRLIFQRGSVRWMCSESFWDEDLLSLNLDDSPKKRSFSILQQEERYPSFTRLSVAINSFNRRQLTYPEDAVSAFTGLLNVFSQTFTGGFLFGMPEAFFDIALLWEPTPDMKIRTPRRLPNELFADLQVPTWSWAAWTGNFIAQAWSYYESTDNNADPRSLRYVSPTVEWFTMVSPLSTSRRKLQSTWFEYRSNAQDLTKPLPLGWNRHEKIKEGSDGQECTHYFTHHSTMERRWNWPFPIPQPDEIPIMPEPTPYLFCRASRAYLFVDRPDKAIMNSRYPAFIFCLKDVLGKCVGVLFVQDRENLSCLSTSDWKLQKIEVVEISRTMCAQPERGYDEEKRYGILPTHTPYEYYNVLWVSWDMGVAYRRGLGRVLRGEWEHLRERDVVNLVLR